MVIDHVNSGDNKIFVTCDASDLCTGAVLSWGPTWESARPVAFDSMQLKDAQKNYPVYEKRLLAIVCALKKWRSNPLGSEICVYTEHCTLENFETQKDLSCCQAHWIKHLSQFDMTIMYICGEDNTVADALSCLPNNIADTDTCHDVKVSDPPLYWDSWLEQCTVNTVLTISADESFLQDIKSGHEHDDFCKKLSTVDCSIPGIKFVNNLWYIGNQLVISCYGTVCKDLFHHAYNTLGHFGSDKSYSAIRDCYYWPNMQHDLETAYVLACTACQRNKSLTSKQIGPLHLFQSFMLEAILFVLTF
jgi:hypothetical protein